MRTITSVLAAVVAVALLAGNARAENKVPEKIKEALEKATSIELYSLDPTPPKDKLKDDFYGWKILGKTTVRDAETRKRIAEALVPSAADNKRIVGDRFEPRHCLPLAYGGKPY